MDTVNYTRQMLRDYYGKLLDRSKELEEERDVYEKLEDTLNLPYLGNTWMWVKTGTKMAPPLGVTDEIKFCREELKRWSIER